MLIVIAAMMASSCVDEMIDRTTKDEQGIEKVQMTFSAVSDADTKLTLVDKTQIWWEPGDFVVINGDCFYSTLEAPSLYSEFSGQTVPADEYRAVASNEGIFYVDGDFQFTLPPYQQALKDNLPIFYSAAKCKNPERSLHFKCLLGYIKFTIPEDGWSLNEVKVRANGGETLALGYPDYTVIDFSENEPRLIHPDEGFRISSVTMTSPLGMEPGDYYIALYPGTYSRGLKFTFKSEDGRMAIKNITKEITLESGAIKNIGVVSDDWCAEYDDQLALERQALIELYNATGGDNWKNNDNWCSDKPIEEWYGVSTESGLLWELYLFDNNLRGSIPESIGVFSELQFLTLGYNNITGNIPESIGNLARLKELDVQNNNLSGSIPESIGNMTGLSSFILRDNALTGCIPESIGGMTNLETLFLDTNQLTGELPASIGNLTKLRRLSAINNNFTGSIPESIGNLINLEGIWLQGNKLTGELPASIGNLIKLRNVNLSLNELSGTIPESINNISTLEHFSIRYNYFTGTVPKSLMEMEAWPVEWPEVLEQEGEGMSGEGLVIPAPKFVENTIDGEVLDYSVYSENEYTVLFHYFDWCPWSHEFMPTLFELYHGYKNKGLEVIAFSGAGTVESHRKFDEQYNSGWPYITLFNNISLFKAHVLQSPAVCVVDKDGYIVFNHLTDKYVDLGKFLQEKLGEPDSSGTEIPKLYESTDYSRDGEVWQLQAATKGKGIDIVLMGDAYSDRLIANGIYDWTMQSAMEKFFEVEPYKSFRDCFNVYYVTVVSRNEIYSSGAETAFNGYFGAGTEVGGDNQTAFSYASKAISEDRMDQALIVIMMNSTAYAGTCYMYDPTSYGDWGNGISVSYFPTGRDDETFAEVLQHEAGGHGFAKLGDEYVDSDYGHIPNEEIQYYKDMEYYGWWKNVDFTDDPDEVKWTNFLNDPRYAGDGLGIFEGACACWSEGVYRSTENSIMRNNTDGFNAPSREAIYYRIHKLAYGADWEYDYEEFVEYDAINRKSASEATAPQKRRMNYVEKPFEPTHPPVVIRGSWRDAMK